MTDSEEISVCLTAEEYDGLVKTQGLFNEQKEKHQKQLDRVNQVREKEIGDLSEALEGSYVKYEEMEKSQKKLGEEVERLKKELASVQGKCQQQIVEVEEGKRKSELEVARLEKEKIISSKELQNLQKAISTISKESDLKSNQISSLEKELSKQKASNQPSNDKGKIEKECEQLRVKYNKLLQEKNELVDKYKIAELRMENKEEFVCNYYESMKQKLADFDKSEVKQLINNDIDDFIAYLTSRKTASLKK